MTEIYERHLYAFLIAIATVGALSLVGPYDNSKYGLIMVAAGLAGFWLANKGYPIFAGLNALYWTVIAVGAIAGFSVTNAVLTSCAILGVACLGVWFYRFLVEKTTD